MITSTISYGAKSALTLFGAYRVSKSNRDWELAEAVAMVVSGILGVIATSARDASFAQMSSGFFLGACICGFVYSYNDYQNGVRGAGWVMVSNSFFIVCTTVSLAGGPIGVVVATYGLGVIALAPVYVPMAREWINGH